MVTVYSQPACVQCVATYRRLDAKGVEYRVVDVSEDGAALEKIKSLGYLRAPVTIAPDGSHFSGYDPDKIDALAA